LINIEEFEVTKQVIRIRKSKMNRQHNGQKKKVQNYKQRSTKHHTDNHPINIVHYHLNLLTFSNLITFLLICNVLMNKT